MKFATALLLTIFALSMSVSAAEAIRHTYPLDAVSQVQLDAFGSVELTQGAVNQLQITANSDFLPHLHIAMRDGTLVISDTRTDSTWYQTKQWLNQLLGGANSPQNIHYQLTLVAPSALTLNGHFAARVQRVSQPVLAITFNGLGSLSLKQLQTDKLNLTANGKLALDTDRVHGKQLHMAFSGSGQLDAHGLRVDALSGHLNGAIQCLLAGEANTVDWRMEGTGHCSAVRLRTEQAALHIAGQAQMTVSVKHDLKAHTEDQGQINYYGQPRVNTSGSRVKRAHSGYQARIYY